MALLRADANGNLSGAFNIPANVPTGVKRVDFKGSGGTIGFAQYTAFGWKTLITKEVVTNYDWYHVDPLAQTFMLSQPRQLTGIDVKFTALGNVNNPAVIQIRTVENGQPTGTIVTQSVRSVAGVTVCDPLSPVRNESDWTKFDFPIPATLRDNTPYAIVILTDDALHAVAVADLGGFDQVGGYVTSHAFLGGAFLSSNDGRTWLPHPGRSLVFRMRAARYAPQTRVVELGEFAATNATDLMALVLAERPAGTAVEAEFETPAGDKFPVGTNTGVPMPFAVTGNIKVRLKLIGSATLSPILFPQVQLVAGALGANADYVSRAFPCGTDTKVKAVIDVYKPGTSTITVRAQTGVTGGNPVWSTMALSNATPIGDGWVEQEYMIDHITTANTRIKLEFTGGPASRPTIANLRGVAVPSTTG